MTMMIKIKSSYRDLIAFWIFGLSNNFAYVVMLSAANDIIKKQESVKIRQQSAPENGSNILGDKCVEDLGEPKCWSEMSTGAILIANIIPALVIKIIFPFFMQRIPYGFRHLMVCLLQALSYIVVAFSWSIELSLFGVVLASLGSGLGESLYLGLSSHYPKNTITAWSSGTGGAGIFGALAYAALTEPHFAALTPKEALLSMLVIPFLLAVSYWSVLTIAPTVHRLELLKLRTWLAPRLNPQPVGESTSTSIPEKCNSKQSTTTVGSVLKEFCHKLQLTIPLLRYMIPLGVVYICEYVINSGLHQLIDYDCAHGLGLSVESQFRWYQALYQVGVFVSRSSIGFLELPTVALYILPFLQMFLLGVFYCQAVYLYIPHIVILFILTFVEGIFGGASYANTFNQIHRKFNLSDVREFSLSICSVSDSLGITIAAFLAIAIYNHVCRLRSSSP